MRSFYLVVFSSAIQACSLVAGFGEFSISRDGGNDASPRTDASSPDANMADRVSEDARIAEAGHDAEDVGGETPDAPDSGDAGDPCAKCDDDIACTEDICAVDLCLHEPHNSLCPVRSICDPEAGGCVPPPIDCSEDRDCLPLRDPCLDDRCEGGRCYPLHDEDGDGQAATVCGGMDCDDENPLVFFSAEETCDGIDEDCDGVVDGNSRPCRADPSPCGEDEEVCRDGLWGACTPVPRGEEILCNGLDDNCNGAVDELGGCWTEVASLEAPTSRTSHAMVTAPDGTVIVWGGDRIGTATDSGGIYDPTRDSWVPTSLENAPSARWVMSATWTEQGMLIFGGYNRSGGSQGTGGLFNPTTNTWRRIAEGSARYDGSATWVPSASMVVVFGGQNPGLLGAGGSYHLPTNTWVAGMNEMAPSARTNHVAVLDPTRGRVVIWGGVTPDLSGEGAVYDPLLDLWSPIPTEGAPAARALACSAWVADLDAMLVVGGRGGEHTGAFYFPDSNNWRAIAIPDDILLPAWCTSAWTGNELVILWAEAGVMVGTRYHPTTDHWLPIPRMPDSPAAREHFTLAWTNETAMIWGGLDEGGRPLGTGYRYRLSR